MRTSSEPSPGSAREREATQRARADAARAEAQRRLVRRARLAAGFEKNKPGMTSRRGPDEIPHEVRTHVVVRDTTDTPQQAT